MLENLAMVEGILSRESSSRRDRTEDVGAEAHSGQSTRRCSHHSQTHSKAFKDATAGEGRAAAG